MMKMGLLLFALMMRVFAMVATAAVDVERGAHAQQQQVERPPPAPAQPPRRRRVRILAVLASVAAAGIAGFRRYNHGRSNATKNTSNPHQGLGGCHAPFTIPLWPHGKVPLARPDLEEAGHAPFLTAYVPQVSASVGTSAVIAPGGGYFHLETKGEGTPYAQWLCGQGVASYVLHYRCAGTGYHAPVPELDAKRAMRVVRSRLRPSIDDTFKVGMIGSSAGGHLTATVLAYHDEGNPHAADPIERKSCRPDFGVLVYPVITMEGEAANAFSKTNLFGPGLTPAETQNLTEHYSIEKHVGKTFPPTFLFHTKDDADVSVENAVRMDDALTAAGVYREVDIYDSGPHSQGLGEGSVVTGEGELLNGHPWTRRCLAFLTKLGMLEGR